MIFVDWFYRGVAGVVLYFIFRRGVKKDEDTSRIIETGYKMDYTIRQTWNGSSVTHPPTRVSLASVDAGVLLEIDAAFLGDPRPPGPPGQNTPQLWNYEVVEAFFRNPNDEYLQVVLGPYGHYITLFFKGQRVESSVGEEPLNYTAGIDPPRWNGSVVIPATYFPPKVASFNVHAQHGSVDSRTYESLYPAPKEDAIKPDFHDLDNFQPIDFRRFLAYNFQSDSRWVASKQI